MKGPCDDGKILSASNSRATGIGDTAGLSALTTDCHTRTVEIRGAGRMRNIVFTVCALRIAKGEVCISEEFSTDLQTFRLINTYAFAFAKISLITFLGSEL